MVWGVNVEWLNSTYPIGSKGWCEKLVMLIVNSVVGKLWTMEVPEGSVLVPLLFIACINYWPFEINAISDLIVSADNTNVSISKHNNDDFKHMSNLFLFNICEWFDVYQLVLNVDKNCRWWPRRYNYFGLFIYSQSALHVSGDVFTRNMPCWLGINKYAKIVASWCWSSTVLLNDAGIQERQVDKNVVNFTTTNSFHFTLAVGCRKTDKRNA